MKKYRNKAGSEIEAIERENDFIITLEARWVHPEDEFSPWPFGRVVKKAIFNEEFEEVK